MDNELLQLKKLGADYEQAMPQIREKEAYTEAVKAFFLHMISCDSDRLFIINSGRLHP